MSKKDKTPSLFGVEEPQPPVGTHIIRVALASAADTEFDYLVPDAFWPVAVGQRVAVPFGRGNRPEEGFCVESDLPREAAFGSEDRGIRLKAVTRVVDERPLLDAQLMELARWIGDYYVCPLGQVLAAMVPGAVKRAAGVRTQRLVLPGAYPQEPRRQADRSHHPEESALGSARDPGRNGHCAARGRPE